jgi:hypothetical protein
VGRIIMIGAAIVLAIVFLPGLLQGGSGGAKDAGSKAGDSVVNVAKDPHAALDAASNATKPVKDVAGPWWEYLVAQPWFYGMVAAGIGLILARRAWMQMGPAARYLVVGVAVIAIMFTMFKVASR